VKSVDMQARHQAALRERKDQVTPTMIGHKGCRRGLVLVEQQRDLLRTPCALSCCSALLLRLVWRPEGLGSVCTCCKRIQRHGIRSGSPW
jgi:hypothetical protein